MSPEEFEERATAGNNPPGELSASLQALWKEKQGDWEEAHRLCQEAGSPEGHWVHAYLHRKEGDEGNAAYWYQRAGKPKSSGSLDHEWRELVQSLL